MPNNTLSAKELDSIITAPPPVSLDKINVNLHPWPGAQSVGPDSSRIDRLAQALKHKLETKGNFDEAKRTLKKVFASADIDGSGSIDEGEFVKLMASKLNFVGCEVDIQALFRRFDVDRSGKLDFDEFYGCLHAEAGNRSTTAIGKVREILSRRGGGTTTLKSLSTEFRIMDTEHKETVDRDQLELGFQKFTRAFGVILTKYELDELFSLFDVDKTGKITYDEFIKGVRGGMNEARLAMVKLAFKAFDERGAGVVTLEDMAKKYDVSQNPMVKSGKATPTQVLQGFMAHWHLHEKIHTDDITLAEFIEYYQWISPSIDRDDYFELMIRNAWHISGGSGWSENTSNIRVLVVHEDDSETVEEIKNDLGLRRDDKEGIMRRLAAQGVKAKSITLK